MAKSIIYNKMTSLTHPDRINYYNMLAMLASACLAIIIPFELVLLSYAILGPAHYLTEISWLKSRQFFTLKKYDAVIIAAIVGASFLLRLHYANIVFYAFGVSFILLSFQKNSHRVLAFVLLIAAGYFLLANNLARTIFGLYMLTLIHVYFFTGAFLLLGALRSNRPLGYITFGLFLLLPIILCLVFTNQQTIPTAWARINYAPFSSLNSTTLRNPGMNVFTNSYSILLTRVIAFAYTYHYLNWFSKTGVISWHRMSVTRAVLIGVVWTASVALYFYNYRIGFKWLFLLSMSHVILEFPLNHRTFLGIGNAIKRKVFSLPA